MISSYIKGWLNEYLSIPVWTAVFYTKTGVSIARAYEDDSCGVCRSLLLKPSVFWLYHSFFSFSLVISIYSRKMLATFNDSLYLSQAFSKVLMDWDRRTGKTIKSEVWRLNEVWGLYFFSSFNCSFNFLHLATNIFTSSSHSVLIDSYYLSSMYLFLWKSSIQ